MKKAFINWSSGKDAAFALFKMQQKNDFLVEKLVTTVNSDLERISMHGLRKELLVRQAEEVGLPLHIIPLSGNVSMKTYDGVMKIQTSNLMAEGFEYSIFGDIFLEDLRKYREEQLQEVSLKALFPLWQRDTTTLIQDFLSAGFKAITVCVNAKLLDQTFCGRIVDESFLKDLPKGVDPCGENGEFHTFVFDGPIFHKPVKFLKGEIVQRTYESNKEEEEDCFSDEKERWDSNFWYCDLLPG